MKCYHYSNTNIQQDWIKNKEEGLKTGLLIWDLSAAFDTLDIDLLCKKRIAECIYYKLWNCKVQKRNNQGKCNVALFNNS